LGDQEIGIVIGDASGHGVGPALVATDTHAYVRALTETQIDLANALSIANRLLCDEMVDGRFVTLLFVRLDARTRSLIYSSAGHHPTGYVLDTAGGLRTRLYSTGLPMGVSTDSDFPVAPAITLEPGDLVLLATDGIPETTSPDGTLFGMERALNVVRTHRHRRAQEIVEALLRAVQDFSQNTPRHDDITAVVVKVQPTARKDGFVQ
ncbi:MAG: PP2C family protein-serine/threonine phosphatase, partial [Phycisphaerae bacterium]